MEGECPARRLSFVALIAAVVVIGGLVVPPGPSSAQTPSEGTLRVALQQDIPDFNIWNLASNSIWKSYVLNWGFEGLVDLDYDGSPMPVLAESWTFSEANLTWTFYLRHGVTFHDGSAMDADDVVFTYKAARSGTVHSAELTSAFDSDADGWCSEAEMDAAVAKVDQYTVAMKMANPYGRFLTTVALIPIVPQSVWLSHVTWEGLLDVLWNDAQATIGTGPFMYAGGVAGDYRLMDRYSDYWGKTANTPLGYRMYPSFVEQLRFDMYPGIDSILTALQAGQADILPWALPSSRVYDLQSNPFVDLWYLSDNGYFYLAFNEKFDPMGSLPFRRAVSHVIDKDQIVDVYMNGLGMKGDAVLSPFWGADAWYNSSVDGYPYDPDFSTPNTFLDEAGFADSNGDGWRDLPDGTPMEKLTILTPPEDYDPVRVRAGQMIAKNMRDGLHINAEAEALDFDTLVTRLQSMDFQLLIIGWSLTSDPVGNVFDIIGPRAASNTFGFWSEANPNPFYNDLWGVSTRADAATQALADEVLELEGLAKYTFSVTDQITYTRWAEGVIAEAVPVNVLYYRVNVEATRTEWTGWLPSMGTMFNSFSMGNLVYSGGWTGYREVTSGLDAGLSLPGQVPLGESVQGSVMAIDDQGLPVMGATVELSVTGVGGPPSVTLSELTGSTDAAGLFSFSAVGVAEGVSELTATVSLGLESASDSCYIDSVPSLPGTLSLTISADKYVLRPGETADFVIEVRDEMGLTVSGVAVWVDTNLIGYGSVNWTSGTALTDANGLAYLRYTAPADISMFVNAHLSLTLSFYATRPGSWTATGAANLMVLDESPPNWKLTQVDASKTGAVSLSRASNSTAIAVMAFDVSGTPLRNKVLQVEYSAPDLLFSPAAAVMTGGTGAATVPIQFKDSPTSSALRVTIGFLNELNHVPATVTLTYAGDAPVPTMYGGYMIWDTDWDTATQEPQFMVPGGDITATAFVWNETGAPADGVDSALIVAGTPSGSLAWCDLINWDSTWDGWGINIITSEDDTNIVTSGPFNTPFDYDDWDYWYNYAGYIYWDWGTMTGVQVTGGQLEIGIYSQDVAPIDWIGKVYLVPGAMCTFSGMTLSYQVEGPTVITSDYVMGRTYNVLATEVSIDDPVLEARTSGYDETGVDLWVTDQDGLPAEAVSVKVYENGLRGNTNYKVYPHTTSQWMSAWTSTDASGYANATITAIGKNFVVTDSSLAAPVYAKAAAYGYYSMLAQAQIAIHVRPCFVAFDPIPEVQILGDLIVVNATVTDSSGGPLAGMSVVLDAGTATVTDPVETTDSWGRVGFYVDTSSVSNTTAGFLQVMATADGTSFEAAQALMRIAMRNSSVDAEPPVADAGPDQIVLAGVEVVFNGNGSSDNFGIVNWTWTFSYDGTDYVLYGEIVNFTFLSEPGTATVTLTVRDAQGLTDSDTMLVDVSGWIPEFGTVVLPVLGIAAAMLLAGIRRRRAHYG